MRRGLLLKSRVYVGAPADTRRPALSRRRRSGATIGAAAILRGARAGREGPSCCCSCRWGATAMIAVTLQLAADFWLLEGCDSRSEMRPSSCEGSRVPAWEAALLVCCASLEASAGLGCHSSRPDYLLDLTELTHAPIRATSGETRPPPASSLAPKSSTRAKQLQAGRQSSSQALRPAGPVPQRHLIGGQRAC